MNIYLIKKNNIENLTSTELGNRSYSSQSTVIRLYKKLGLNNYREFMTKLAIEKKEYRRAEDILNGLPFQKFASYEDTKNTVIQLYEKILIETNLLIDQNTMIRISNRLMSASSIDIYGIGISGNVAEQMAFKLQSTGCCSNCSYQNGLNYYYIQNMNNYQSNVSVLFSLTGSNETMLNIAKILKEKGIYTISITAKTETELIQLCQENLFFGNLDYQNIDVMCSIFAAEYLVNFIYSLIISKRQS